MIKRPKSKVSKRKYKRPAGRFHSKGWERRRRSQSDDLEQRVAKILKKNGIKFELHKEFDTIDSSGKPNHRSVDFWLEKPIDIYFCDFSVQAIEVKSGGLTWKCWEQKEELEYVDILTFIANPAVIDFWERYGFLRKV